MPLSHFIRARPVVLACAVAMGLGEHAAVAGQAPGASTSATFTIFLRSAPVGSEQIAVQRTADGWTITSSGRMGAPINVVARQVQVRYRADWTPVDLYIDASQQGQPLTDVTAVTGASAHSTITQGNRTIELNDAVASDAVLLPSPFWGPYEALAERARTAAPGSAIPAYNLQAAVQIAIGASAAETIQTPAGDIHARRTSMRIPTPDVSPLDIEVWGDENGHLLRLVIPAQDLDIVREDLVSVAARGVVVSRPGDEQVRIPADGFSLAATISKPAAAATAPLPAVVLVGSSGPADRDESLFGIPIFGQLAGALADAGFLVLRYDKRGSGQSGGRAESASLSDFSDDLRGVVKFTSDRKDVDRKRIAVIGHGEGGAVAMLTAARENRVAALVLAGASSVSGADLNLYQVARGLERSNRPEAERQSTINLQKQIQTAVLSGSGWDKLPATVRAQAETPWFESFLSFDPAKVMSGVDQPVLIVQGDLDTQLPPANADRLGTLAMSRKKARATTEVVKVAGVNHLLVPASTGEIDEYAQLKDRRVSPAVADALTVWLRKTFGSIR
jgi:pimeloyl-ACP methyl ester carboxylesterase